MVTCTPPVAALPRHPPIDAPRLQQQLHGQRALRVDEKHATREDLGRAAAGRAPWGRSRAMVGSCWWAVMVVDGDGWCWWWICWAQRFNSSQHWCWFIQWKMVAGQWFVIVIIMGKNDAGKHYGWCKYDSWSSARVQALKPHLHGWLRG